MSRDILHFRMRAPFGAAFTSSRSGALCPTYPVPTPSAIKGMISSSFGMERLDYRLSEQLDISLEVHDFGEVHADTQRILRRARVDKSTKFNKWLLELIKTSQEKAKAGEVDEHVALTWLMAALPIVFDGFSATIHSDIFRVVIKTAKEMDLIVEHNMEISGQVQFTSLQRRIAEQLFSEGPSAELIDTIFNEGINQLANHNTYYGGVKTIERIYGGEYTVYVALKPDATVTLADIKSKLQDPVYPLYMGQSGDVVVFEDFSIGEFKVVVVEKLTAINSWAKASVDGEFTGALGKITVRMPVASRYSRNISGEVQYQNDHLFDFDYFYVGITGRVKIEKGVLYYSPGLNKKVMF